MNREQARTLLANIEIIRAFADGKPVQHHCAAGWMESDNLSFFGAPDAYRIKPEPRRIVLRDMGTRFEFPNAFGDGPGDKYVEFIEVLK